MGFELDVPSTAGALIGRSNATYPRALLELTVLFDDLLVGAGQETHSFLVIPQDVEVDRNHHREADTFRATIDWRDFPIDPRAVRSILVAVLLGDVGDPSSEIPRYDRRFQAFIGFVDEPETTMDDRGGQVKLSGRDYTGLFLDYTWVGSIDIRRPLSAVLRGILNTVPGAATIRIGFGTGTGGVVLATILGKTRYAPKSGDDAWTVIVELCAIAGLVPVIDNDVLAVRTPNAVQARSVTLQYGRDVDKITYRRKFNEARTSQVQVVCWDDQARETRSAKHPPLPLITKRKVGADGKVSTQFAPLVSWYVQGAYTLPDLAQIAQSIYEDIAREQVDGSIETHEMRDINGTELWALANGDQIDVVLGSGDASSIHAMSDAEAVATLTAGHRGMNPLVAAALVASTRRAERLATRFYVRRARHKWSADDGYKLDVEFITYVGNGGR